MDCFALERLIDSSDAGQKLYAPTLTVINWHGRGNQPGPRESPRAVLSNPATIGDANMASKYHSRHPAEPSGLDCPVCGHEPIVVVEGTAVCPGCDESYSVVAREEFTLLESDGWTLRVTLDAPEALAGGCSG